MKKIIIIGSGGFAAEAYSYISQHENAEIKFIDDVDPNYAREDIKPKIIGKISDLDDSIISENLFFIGYGDPRKKQVIYNSIKEFNLKYYSFIHPTSQVSTSAKLSDGCFLYPFTVIANNAKIGSHCVINSYSAIGHDSTLGNFSTLSAHVDITGNVNVGEVSNRLHVGKRSSGSNSFLKPSFQDPGAASFLHLLRRLLAAWHRPTSGRLCLLWEPQLYNPPGARLL